MTLRFNRCRCSAAGAFAFALAAVSTGCDRDRAATPNDEYALERALDPPPTGAPAPNPSAQGQGTAHDPTLAPGSAQGGNGGEPNDGAGGGSGGRGVRGSVTADGPGRATPESATILGNTGGTSAQKGAATGGTRP